MLINLIHHTFLIFVMSCITLVVVSFFTKPKSEEELEGVIWTKSALSVGEDATGQYGGWNYLNLFHNYSIYSTDMNKELEKAGKVS